MYPPLSNILGNFFDVDILQKKLKYKDISPCLYLKNNINYFQMNLKKNGSSIFEKWSRVHVPAFGIFFTNHN